VRLAVVALAIELNRHERLRGLPGRIRDDVRREDWIVRIRPASPASAATLPPEAGEEPLRFRVLHASRFDPIALSVVLPGMTDPVAAESEWRPGQALWSGTVAGLDLTVQVRPGPAGIRLTWRGVDLIAQVMTPRIAELQALMPAKKPADSTKYVRCPMPGLVVTIEVKAGQKVHTGDPLCVIEAMKMENILRAERDAKVTRIDVKPGDVLAVDAVIMELE
jgi:propionyl-CoA carboxylase alpha chain